MPCPVSCTRISACESTCFRCTSIRPPFGVNLTAFDNRFHTTCWRRSASPVMRICDSGSSATLHLHAFGDSAGPCRLDGGGNDGGQIDRLGLHRQLARHDSRNIEEILDQLRLRPGVALDGLERPLPNRRGHRADAQHVGPSEHGVERRPQLVREARQKLVLDAMRLGQILGELPEPRFRFRNRRTRVHLGRHVLEVTDDAAATIRAARCDRSASRSTR